MIEFFESICVFVLVLFVVFVVLYLVGGKEQSIMNDCKRIRDENIRISMEIIEKDIDN